MLERLKKIDLRKAWKSEDQEFTPWLANEENLELLGDTIGIELELVAQEKDVGPFRADILCKNTENESYVLIENQIEKTDHKHLGQLLTYASGLEAVTIIWIASKFTEEHRKSLDWLNEITDKRFKFFGLEIELFQIGDSPYAPRFNVISMPNNWGKSVSQAAKSISEGIESETKALQYKYWQQLVDFIRESGSKLKPHDPRPRHWQTFAIGRSGFNLSATINTQNNKVAVELWITNKENAKSFFKLLESEKEQIENEIGDKLEWRENPDKTSSKIIIAKDFNPTVQDNWGNQHGWLKENIERFDSIFRKRIKVLRVEN